METTENKTTPARLPVIGTLREAWATVFQMRSRLAIALIIPFFIDAAVELHAVYGVGNDAEHYPLWVTCVLGLAMAIAAVTCHRIVLLGFESVGEYGVAATDSSLWHYIGRCLLMGLTLMLVVIPIVMLATPIFMSLGDGDANQPLMKNILAIVLVIPLASLFAFAFGQLSLTLPAAAIAKRLGFVEAFELANGNAWRVAALVFGAPLIIEILLSIAGAIVPAFLFVLTQLLLKWLVLPFEIAILSLCYKRLSDARESISVAASP